MQGKHLESSNIYKADLLASPNIGRRLINPMLGYFLLFSPLLILSFFDLSKRFPTNSFSFESLIDYLKIHLNADFGIFIILIVKVLAHLTPVFTITTLELFNNGKIQLSDLKNSSLGRIGRSNGFKYADIWYKFLHILTQAFPFIVTFMTIGLVRFNQSMDNFFNTIYTKFLPTPTSHLNSVILIIIALLATDFCQFIAHRMAHKVRFIWDLHEFHHSATEMTIFSVDRNTPWEDIFTKPFVLPLSVLTGLLLNACLLEGYLLPFFIYLIDTLIDEMNFYVGHSSLKVIYPKPFSYFYISPALHWLHHSDNPNHYDCNFGTKYPFWDKLFGSYLDESYLKDNFKFGVPNTEYNKYHPLISYYFLPLMKIIRRLRRSFA